MITIITPTYNRAYILPTLYHSLCRQTQYSFEWIIIDDGSDDNTEELAMAWLKDHVHFKITYVKKENGGKHRAINDAVKRAAYDWCLIVDSDDFLTEDAVESIHQWIETVKEDANFAGVSGLKGRINTDEIIGQYPTDKQYAVYIDAKNTERKKCHLQGDKSEVYRTSILRQFPFPEYEGENFITEGVVWDAIACAGYKLRWFNKVIYKCEYLPDGLTKKGRSLSLENFEGFTHYMRIRIGWLDWYTRQLAIGAYISMAKEKGLTVRSAYKKLGLSTKHVILPLVIRPIRRWYKKIKSLYKKV